LNLLIQRLLKARHVSSGIPLIIRSSKLYLQPLVYIQMWWPAVVKSEWSQTWQRPVTTCVCKPEAANTVLELLMMSSMPLETWWSIQWTLE